MKIRDKYHELIKQLDIAVVDYEHAIQELREINTKIGLEAKKIELYDKSIDLLNQLCVAHEIVRVRYPYLEAALDHCLKLNKVRKDAMVNFLTQKYSLGQIHE